jgi:hypothetical protein
MKLRRPTIFRYIPTFWFLHFRNIIYYPPKEWAFKIPVAALILFFAIPIVYVWLNSLTVPPTTSSDLLEDQYTRKPTTTIKLQKG